MARRKRNIGQEIFDGLREIKSGKHGRVINVPEVPSPAWHEKILDVREENIKQGKDEFIDWETAKKNIKQF